MKKSVILIIVVIILIIIVGFYYFYIYNKYPSAKPINLQKPMFQVNESLPQNENVSINQGAGATRETILIQNFSFNPRIITIKAGSTVGWINNDQVTHTVTGDNLNSGPLSNGQTYSQTFNEPGVYNYHCSIHSSMQGQIKVIE